MSDENYSVLKLFAFVWRFIVWLQQFFFFFPFCSYFVCWCIKI